MPANFNPILDFFCGDDIMLEADMLAFDELCDAHDYLVKDDVEIVAYGLAILHCIHQYVERELGW